MLLAWFKSNSLTSFEQKYYVRLMVCIPVLQLRTWNSSLPQARMVCFQMPCKWIFYAVAVAKCCRMAFDALGVSRAALAVLAGPSGGKAACASSGSCRQCHQPATSPWLGGRGVPLHPVPSHESRAPWSALGLLWQTWRCAVSACVVLGVALQNVMALWE